MIPPLGAIFAWPVVAFIFFKRFSLQAAICVTIIAGYLFLPQAVKFNLPVLPAIDKHTMPAIAALVLALLITRQQARSNRGQPAPGGFDVLPGYRPRSLIGTGLIAILIIGAFLTVMTNGDRLVYGERSLPGLRIYDGFAAVLSTIMTLLPLLIARKYLASDAAHRVLLLTMCLFALGYSFLALYEIRMSPRLNAEVYGFFPSSWRQHNRGGGFRPLVFLKHGLWLGIFFSSAILAAIAYARASGGMQKYKFLALAFWLFATLALSKTIGAFAITLLLVPVVLFLNARLQLVIAACIAGTVLFYPMLRGADLIPVDRIVSVARSYDANRGASLQYRINNEDILLAKANQRPAFGWGGWGRARVYDEFGRDVSTTDGRWVISIGNEGWVGYIGRFGLLCIPIILLAYYKRRYDVSLATSGLCVALAANLVDLIPNAGLTSVTWLMAGALLGRLEMENATAPEAETGPPDPRAGRVPRARKTATPDTGPDPVLARNAPAQSRYSRPRPLITRK